MDSEILQAAFYAQFLWLVLAFTGAAFRHGPISKSLGLAGLPWSGVQLVVVAVGFLCLSSAMDLTLRASPLRAESSGWCSSSTAAPTTNNRADRCGR